jgi:hypothetical protein
VHPVGSYCTDISRCTANKTLNKYDFPIFKIHKGRRDTVINVTETKQMTVLYTLQKMLKLASYGDRRFETAYCLHTHGHAVQEE